MQKTGVKCYDIDTSGEPTKLSYKATGDYIKNHYFTITAIIEDEIKKAEGRFDGTMYEVSTWGQKYYVSEKEIRDFTYNYSSLFTNVVYIKRINRGGHFLMKADKYCY